MSDRYLTIDTSNDPLNDISEHGDGSLLLTTVYINDVPHHLNAVRVKKGEYDGSDPAGASLLDDFYHAYEGPWMTTKIGRRRGRYVIVIHPHGD